MKNVICKKCGYGWQTKSKMFMVSCPCCGQKVNLKEKIEKEVQEE